MYGKINPMNAMRAHPPAVLPVVIDWGEHCEMWQKTNVQQ